MKRYTVQVKRASIVSVRFNADSPESALNKYYDGKYNKEEEETLDCSDIEDPIVIYDDIDDDIPAYLQGFNESEDSQKDYYMGEIAY